MTALGTIHLVNRSTQVTDAQVQAIAAACTRQLTEHVAPALGLPSVPVVFEAHPETLTKDARLITVMDTLDDAQALGYHTESAGGRQWGVVGTKAAMGQGAQALTGPYSIASITSHEVIELFGDPGINVWADNGHGLMVAWELCDPVEDAGYDLGGCSVSNFVLPAWFDHLSAKTARFDYLGKLSKPFTMTRAGYWVEMKAGKTSERFGADMPDWRRATKQAQFSRAHRRVNP